MKLFLNYRKNYGLSIDTYRNTGCACSEHEDFLEQVIKEVEGNISIESESEVINLKEALEDGEFLKEFDWSQEQVENAWSLFETFIINL